MAGKIALELRRVRVIPCAGTKDDSPFLQAALVLRCTTFWNASTYQRTEERSCRASGAGTRDGARDGTRNDETDAGDGDSCRRRHQRSDRRADPHANAPTNAGAFSGLRAFLEFLA